MLGQKLLVVNYHYIRDPGNYQYPGIHSIPVSVFSQQIDNLSNAFRIATPFEVEAFSMGDATFFEPTIFFTFDDGLVDHYWAAKKILDRRGIKAGFFVSTRPLTDRSALVVHKTQWLRAHTPPSVFYDDFIALITDYFDLSDQESCQEEAVRHYRFDNRRDAYVKYLINFVLPSDAVDSMLSELLIRYGVEEGELCRNIYMGVEHIQELQRGGHLIGAHTHSHVRLNKNKSEWSDDILKNKRVIEDIIGEIPTWISYPHGDRKSLPKNPRKFCKEYQFKIGLTMERGWNTIDLSPYEISRIDQNDIPRFTAN